MSWTAIMWGVATMPRPTIRAVALHGVMSVGDYKPCVGVSKPKN
jgi:hypothetical protein